MRPTSIPRVVLPALCLALGAGGCDDKKDTEEKKTAKAEDKDKDKGSDKDAKSEKGDGGGEGKTPTEKDAEIAALKAELEAANEAKAAANELDPDAAKELDEPPEPEDEVAHEKKLEEGKKGPVSVANVSFIEKNGFGDRGLYFDLSAEITVNEKKDGGVYAKASCVMGEEVFVNVATIGTQHTDLGKMNKDETKRLDTGVFRSGLPEKPAGARSGSTTGRRTSRLGSPISAGTGARSKRVSARRRLNRRRRVRAMSSPLDSRSSRARR